MAALEVFLTVVAFGLIAIGSVILVCVGYDKAMEVAERCRQAKEFSKPWPWVCPRCFTPNNDNYILTTYTGRKMQGGCKVCFEIETAESEIFFGKVVD